MKKALGNVVDGKAFLLQEEIVESFAEFHPDNIRDTFKVLLQMSLVLTTLLQFVCKNWKNCWTIFKPRSLPTEKKMEKYQVIW